MRLRKLRIAFSAVCGVVCLLLIVLWVRSYTWIDFYDYGISSYWGKLYYHKRLTLMAIPGKPAISTTSNQHVGGSSFLVDDVFVGSLPGGIGVPYWLLVALCTACALIPWVRHAKARFSLRTLLVATTLVAVAFGAIAIAARR